ncbi:matrixin family metalloprotease [Polyangium aurulentum]|uniref:matrixin family metalloprotease n=1 Tax=Polyangium aurulentum TaxID=2567896 RepID=UPI00146F2687|nr:matrixin family metalloprotease [Polyangium aurulentum]UQA58215.1 matrixin family metalloprotease [Polyangium aurulentum]
MKSGNPAALIAGAALGLLTALHAPTAAAYCRTAACKDGTGARCTPSLGTDCGKEIFWPKQCVSFSMQRDASEQVSLDLATSVFVEAFKKWTEADCGGGTHPHIEIVDLGPVECHAHEYNQKAANANIILFHDDVWPHPGAGSTLALTTVTYSVDSGEIYDADMELNAANTPFSTGDSKVTYDLHSIATHETGHFLGLSHSQDPTATMYRDYIPGTIDLRTLEPDDIEGICSIYPPGDPIPDSCDPSPRRGFASICSPPPIDPEAGGCCSTAPGAPRGMGSAAVTTLLLGLGIAARRRGDRSRRR